MAKGGLGFVVGLAVGCLLGCGTSAADDPEEPNGTGGGAGQATGGAAGMAGSGSPSGAGGSAGVGGAAPGVVLEPQPECEYPGVACNGSCLMPTESANGCTYMTPAISSLVSMIVSAGDVFLSGGFVNLPPEPVILPGLHRVAGDSLAVTTLDTMNASSLVSLAVAGENLYYLREGFSGDGYLRVVPVGGGTPSDLVTEFDRASNLIVIGDRAYFAAGLPGMGLTPELFWVPVAGGEMQPTELASVGRARANATLLVVSWNGDIRTAPLPDGAPELEVMTDFELTRESWWIDDTFVYWQKDSDYKRSSLALVDATEEQGELVTTLPEGMLVAADAGAELVLTATIENRTGVFTMPLTGGVPQKVGVVGSDSVRAPTLDASYLYLFAESGVLRLER